MLAFALVATLPTFPLDAAVVGRVIKAQAGKPAQVQTAGKELTLVVPPDLAATIAEKSVPATTPVAEKKKEDIKARMDAVVAAIRNNPTLLNQCVEASVTETAGGTARLTDIHAPSRSVVAPFYAKLAPSGHHALDDYNVAYLEAQVASTSPSSVRKREDIKKEFLQNVEVVRIPVDKALASATSPDKTGPQARDEFFAALAAAAQLRLEKDSIARQFGTEKTTYGGLDVFEAGDYRDLMSNMSRVVAFYGDDDIDLIGTGVLIGPTCVLTCSHVANDSRFRRSAAIARLPLDPANPKDDRVFRIGAHVYDAAKTNFPADLAVVEIVPDDNLGTLAPGELSIFDTPERDTPIYVLAMHRNNVLRAAVYDSAVVLFPARVSGSEFGAFFTDTMLGLAVRLVAGKASLDEARKLREDLENCYQAKLGMTAPNKSYSYVRKFDSTPRHVFGFGTDTVKGNSGGGVFTKKKGQLVGLIAGGMPDGLVERQSDWARHEFGIPGNVIAKFLTLYKAAASSASGLPLANVKSESIEPFDL